MQDIRYELVDGVAVLTLARGKANPFTLPMIREMAAAFDSAEREAGAVVWSSDRPRFFSAGFDVNEVFRYERPQLAEFLTAYSALVGRVLQSPKPTVAALPGQTYAGGAILALACDFRVMASGAYGIALSEINIGVNVPAHVFWMLADAVGVHRAKRMFLTGDPIMADEALTAGLVHELAPEAEVLPRAVELAKKLAAKPPKTYAAFKEMMLGFRPAWPGLVADVETWFSPEAEKFKKMLAEQLARK